MCYPEAALRGNSDGEDRETETGKASVTRSLAVGPFEKR